MINSILAVTLLVIFGHIDRQTLGVFVIFRGSSLVKELCSIMEVHKMAMNFILLLSVLSFANSVPLEGVSSTGQTVIFDFLYVVFPRMLMVSLSYHELCILEKKK